MKNFRKQQLDLQKVSDFLHKQIMWHLKKIDWLHKKSMVVANKQMALAVKIQGRKSK